MTGLNLLKALLVTMKNFVRVPFTVQYPDRHVGLLGMAKAKGTSPLGLMRKNPGLAFRALTMRATVPAKSPQHSRFRGNEFTWLETRCTGCASCAKYCPLGIIEIVTHPGGIDVQEGESYGIDVFDIDIGRCMFCGLCVEACPYDALHMGTKFERSKYTRAELVIPMEELKATVKTPSSWFRPQFEERGFNPYEDQVEDHHDAGRHEQPTPEELRERWVTER